MELDYFLFDNITRGQDFKIKAATGPLSTRTDLQKQFVNYCHFTFGKRGYFSLGSSYAIGGFKDSSSLGYILCVTIETVDKKERSTLAFIGLWFPTQTNLVDFLNEYDPLATVRQVFDRLPQLPKLLIAQEKKSDEVSKDSIYEHWKNVGRDILVENLNLTNLTNLP